MPEDNVVKVHVISCLLSEAIYLCKNKFGNQPNRTCSSRNVQVSCCKVLKQHGRERVHDVYMYVGIVRDLPGKVYQLIAHVTNVGFRHYCVVASSVLARPHPAKTLRLVMRTLHNRGSGCTCATCTEA